MCSIYYLQCTLYVSRFLVVLGVDGVPTVYMNVHVRMVDTVTRLLVPAHVHLDTRGSGIFMYFTAF